MTNSLKNKKNPRKNRMNTFIDYLNLQSDNKSNIDFFAEKIIKELQKENLVNVQELIENNCNSEETNITLVELIALELNEKFKILFQRFYSKGFMKPVTLGK
jgi:hypothetical protein